MNSDQHRATIPPPETYRHKDNNKAAIYDNPTIEELHRFILPRYHPVLSKVFRLASYLIDTTMPYTAYYQVDSNLDIDGRLILLLATGQNYSPPSRKKNNPYHNTP